MPLQAPSHAQWIDRVPGLAALDSDAKRDLAAAARVMLLKSGTTVFAVGQTPQNYLLLLEGDVRVSQMSEGGREIVLYRVLPGEGCAMTTACLLSDDLYVAEAKAETDVTAVAIPRLAFDAMIGRFPLFRRFVLAGFSQRVADLCKLVDEIAFQRIDVRLAHKLLERVDANGQVHLTHQQLASELGTAREVVSRQMHELQRRGWLSATRGQITITDREALERMIDRTSRHDP